jgi:hypothetical protein
MNFSEALDHCKSGFKITRKGWNGPNQYVVLQRGYPEGIPLNPNTAAATGLPEGKVCKFAPYLMMYNAQAVFVPWLASQGDLLAEDWKAVV